MTKSAGPDCRAPGLPKLIAECGEDGRARKRAILLFVEQRRFPRSYEEARSARREIADGLFEESEIFAALDDPSIDAYARGRALGSLGIVRGDDERAAALLRHGLAHPFGTPEKDWQCTCLGALVQRFGSGALPDLEALWSQKVNRDVRDLILQAFGYLGITDHYDEALSLFTRGLQGGRRRSGGIYMLTLAKYLFDCARQGVGSANDVKALIRDAWGKLPVSGGFAFQYLQVMPGIDDASVSLDDVPDPPVFSLWEARYRRIQDS